MAPPTGTLRVGRYFAALLAVFAVLYLLVFWPGKRHTPKLGLDLEGGTQVVFQAKTTNGSQPAKAAMSEARDIMQQRVDAYGVSEATVVVQGSDEIVISIPGRDASSQIASIGAAAQLNFRPVVMPVVETAAELAAQASASAAASSEAAAASASAGTSASTGSSTSSSSAGSTKQPASSNGSATATTSATSSHSAQDFAARPLSTHAVKGRALTAASASPTTAAAAASPTAASTAAAATSSAPSLSAAAVTFLNGTSLSTDPLAYLKGQFDIPTTETDYNKLTSDQQTLLKLAVAHFDCTSDDKPKDDVSAKYLLACDSSTKPSYVFLLGSIIVPGTQISDASAGVNSSDASSGWTVQLSLKSSGQKAWADYTGAHNTSNATATGTLQTCGGTNTPCADYVAFVLDGTVTSSPYNQNAINGGNTQISGNFTQETAQNLAQQLKYGALPLNFGDPLTASNVSATLGSSQLKAGLLAGGIGLILVVIYSLMYYRGLGLVTIASLLVSGGLTYASVVFLGRQIGFTLTLAGIAGFIVAVGITADSFVVFFERIKDEVHEGRSARVAVPKAWIRARRTILSADTVSFLAAAVLYYFAAGDVRGFAFTLGLSTILDLVVVFLFTHPIVSLFSRSKAFGSARFTGLDAVRLGGIAADDGTAAPTSNRARRSLATTVKPQERVPTGTIRLSKSDLSSSSTASSSTAVLDEADTDASSTDVVAPVLDDQQPSSEQSSDQQSSDQLSTDAVTSAEAAAPDTASAADDATDDSGRDADSAGDSATGAAPSTAAERAAARRARLREQNGKGKTS